MPVEVMLVALGGMATFLIMLRMIHTQKMARINARGGGEAADRLERIVAEQAAEMQKMRDRISVLEKLVTDDDRRLAGEIEKLRREDRV